jgi:protein-S-isoprenylcysteine O-methyltransferase Ste14
LSPPRSPLAKALIVAGYTLVFYGALPAGLWAAAAWLDARLGWSWTAASWAWILAIPALLLHLAAVGNLLRDGGGPPISALPPPRLAAAGLYRLVRHPIYVTYNLLMPPAGLLLGSPSLCLLITAAFAPCWMIYATVEERFLLRRFGEPYRDYQRRVGLLPGLLKRR